MEWGRPPERFHRVIVDGNGDAPPGEPHIHHGSDQPGTQQEPVFAAAGLIGAGIEQADDADQIHSAKGSSQNGSPGSSAKAHISHKSPKANLVVLKLNASKASNTSAMKNE